MADVLRSIFHISTAPPSVSVKLPDDSEIRWAKSKSEFIKRRAKELDLDVDFEQAEDR